MSVETITEKKTQPKVSSSRYGNVKRWRHEYKYMIDAKQESILLIKAQCVLKRDPHVRQDGTYLIRSLYFDDMNDTCLAENLSGSDPRSKFRIRYYNFDTNRIVLEKKSKSHGMCLKDSCNITEDECKILMRGYFPIITEEMPDIKKKLLSELEIRGLFPKTIVTYERVPFVYSGGNVRVTFDRKITSSEDIEQFLTGTYKQRPVLPCGHCILEVKWDEVMPLHIKNTLRIDRLEWIAFSKYFMCRKFHQ
ncbi:polyphosphate polymerase domain-containing protein [Butyrivibrio sp. MC2021]|uniref:polyphosphate polymerase domain-containing protein n=1 Tax=Butyrivibrio sp. MC2021 TaxID=1408306 RepID=UPI00068400D5|nr:polyphosphate polymerase domain-containing protein [Butyrivibrio sp. MC2021]